MKQSTGSIYIKRSFEQDGVLTPLPFHRGEKILNVGEHLGPNDEKHINTIVVRRALGYSKQAHGFLQAMLYCTEPGCDVDFMATAVLGDTPIELTQDEVAMVNALAALAIETLGKKWY